MGWYHIVTLLCLGFQNVELSKYNYGVYFEQAAPLPNNLQNPLVETGSTSAKPPAYWNKVDSVSLALLLFTHSNLLLVLTC